MFSAYEFTDCPGCGKRVLITATRCHRCQRPLRLVRGEGARSAKAQTSSAVPDETAHLASEDGYDDEYTDDDYREFVESEFGRNKFKTRAKPWVWITALLLVIFFVYFIIKQFFFALHET